MCHRAHSDFECRGTPIVEVRRSQRHVAQARYTKHEAISLVRRDIEATEIRRLEVTAVREEIAQHSEAFEDIAADRHALVAAGAAVALEQAKALLCFVRDGLLIPAQIAVERRIGRDE